MFKSLIVIATTMAALLCFPGHAAPALDLNVQIAGTLAAASAARQAEFKRLLDQALVWVSSFPPEGDTLLNWQGPREPLKDKTFSFILTDITDPYFNKLVSARNLAIPPNTDAMTFAFGKLGGTFTIATFLFVDRIFYLPDGREREDSFTKLAVILAHEIYGNVQSFLKNTPSELAEKKISRNEQERIAFQAGIDFIERCKKHPTYGTMNAKLKADLDRAEAYERRALRSWQHDTPLTARGVPLHPIELLRQRQERTTGAPIGGVRVTGCPPTIAGNQKVGRNDQCPCGSGKKFKKCHGAN